MSAKRKHVSTSVEDYEFEFVGEDDSRFFTEKFGRRMLQRSELHHRVLNWIMGGKNYVGPVKELIGHSRHMRPARILDIGTGGGIWQVTSIIILRQYR
ncbi:hypothetical protein HWV62_19355 [Athelia sp. TMB]|nr:hypothetical protein HWV62_19355 [Athelia sp. TMB]